MANVMAGLGQLLGQLQYVPQHLVHVGAHEGQEMPYYRAVGIPQVTLVEPIPALAARLRAEHPDATVVECACGPGPGREQLHVMQRTNLSTLAAPRRGDQVAEVLDVEVRRLDDIAPTADAAVIDAQGLELEVLSAAPWESLRLVVVETCTVDDPTMASPYDAVVGAVTARRFAEVERWVRDYDWLNRWARGRGQPRRGGEVRDVVFYRGAR
ncbi:FkbM family methyltransferase [Streptomyces sp. NPDC090026]|uniref:FkbM family methyltransferase n=1 Tax=Streptomyces sp. NPDC090026 TaxID=3365923 RepID=UPI00382E7ABD